MTDVLLTNILEQLTSLNSKVEKNQNTLEELKQEFSTTNVKLDQLEKENSALKENIKQLENRNRKNNLIIFGTPKNNSIQDNINFIKASLDINLELKDINNSYPLGKNEKESIPIKFEFVSQLKKIEILKNAYKLRQKNIKNIYITEDLSKEDQEIHRGLRLFLNKAKSAGKKAVMRHNKLIIGDKSYTHDYLLENPNINFEEGASVNEIISTQEEKLSLQLEENLKRKVNFEENSDDTTKKTRRNPQRKQSTAN
ncbi:unnamed protein product [Phaedon cochleariae]|uniref:Endonuclease-reverse transcriptase n=1 Tax=Phaedon cochleariae TaxID=80249 RepID=A0A9N9X1K9_PHACE|nr:unnamed protein product [Phaedon cochleariae]